VIELASLGSFTDLQMSFLEQLTTSIGIVVNSIEATMQTEGLPTQSQQLAGELPFEMFGDEDESPLEKVQHLQDGLVSFATGGKFDGDDPVYQRLRRELLERADIRDKVPDFVRHHRDLGQF
jgi:hypothetical protein